MRAAAAKTGAAALVVSNHGGRQLDGAPSSISALPPIVDAVGSSIEIMFDGGIRSGQDMMRALALGARACLSGRAYIYGLGAGGQAGVARAIEIMRNELRRHHGADRRHQHRRNRPPRRSRRCKSSSSACGAQAQRGRMKIATSYSSL